jgi:hypothetical protein
MKAFLISKLIQALLTELQKHAPDLILGLADKVLDFVEEKVLGSASQADDAIVLPICKMIRDTFSIPDDD